METGRYGIHGGQYIPETLMNEIHKVEEAYEFYKNDKAFQEELTFLLNEYAGRPSLLYYAQKMTVDLDGAKVYLKREDLNHTGSHKINNVLGQVLMAKKMGKTRVIAETGAGQCQAGVRFYSAGLHSFPWDADRQCTGSGGHHPDSCAGAVPVCERSGTAFADGAEGPAADQPETENRGHPADYDRQPHQLRTADRQFDSRCLRQQDQGV